MENCLECGSKLYGRVDKKFCNDSCRSAYNNRLHRENSTLVRNVHAILKKNYSILSGLNFFEGKCKTTKNDLLSLGFNFNYLTQIKNYKNGAQYLFIYNIGYKYLEDERLLVVRNDMK